MWDEAHIIHAVQSGQRTFFKIPCCHNIACLLTNADVAAIKGLIKTYG